MQGTQALQRALRILFCFDARRPRWTMRALAEACELPRSTVYRIVGLLTESGVLRAVGDTGEVTLGPALIELGNLAQVNIELRQVALPIMRELRDQLGESVNLSVRYDNYRVCIEKVESPHDLRDITHIGKQVPLGLGATGKVLLAFLPASERAWVLAELHLPQLTPLTITDRGAMEAELAQVRSQGWGTSEGERLLGARSVSCPVFDHRGMVAAALTVSGAAARFDRQLALERALPLLRQAAAQLSRALGYREGV